MSRKMRLVDELAPEMELLHQVTARCDTMCAPSEPEVYDALERGFARLVYLEAQLRHRAECIASAGPEPEELRRHIEALRRALAALRGRATGVRAFEPKLCGFVLPVAT